MKATNHSRKDIEMSKKNEDKLRTYLANSKPNTRSDRKSSERSLPNSGGRNGDTSGASSKAR
jgi:hypothetical protein